MFILYFGISQSHPFIPPFSSILLTCHINHHKLKIQRWPSVWTRKQSPSHDLPKLQSTETGSRIKALFVLSYPASVAEKSSESHQMPCVWCTSAGCPSASHRVLNRKHETPWREGISASPRHSCCGICATPIHGNKQAPRKHSYLCLFHWEDWGRWTPSLRHGKSGAQAAWALRSGCRLSGQSGCHPQWRLGKAALAVWAGAAHATRAATVDMIHCAWFPADLNWIWTHLGFWTEEGHGRENNREDRRRLSLWREKAEGRVALRKGAF